MKTIRRSAMTEADARTLETLIARYRPSALIGEMREIADRQADQLLYQGMDNAADTWRRTARIVRAAEMKLVKERI